MSNTKVYGFKTDETLLAKVLVLINELENISIQDFKRVIEINLSHNNINPVRNQQYYIGQLPQLAPLVSPQTNRSFLCLNNGFLLQISVMIDRNAGAFPNLDMEYYLYEHQTNTEYFIGNINSGNTEPSGYTKILTPSNKIPLNSNVNYSILWKTPNWNNELTVVRHSINLKIEVPTIQL